MWKRCFPVIFLVFASSAVNALPGYLFTISRFLWKGTNEQYCISYHGDSVVTFNVSMRHLVTNEQYWFDEQTFDGESSRCIDFEVPDSKGKVNVSLVGRNQSGEILYSEMGSSEIFDTNLVTLIQTDKPLYKPGQLVKFRILTFKQNLKPRTGIISLVSILNPSGVRVMQWKDVDASQGLVSFEFQLSKEPQLNTWKIEAQVDGEVTRQNFKVEEYVLPKYEVTITPPKYLLPTSETIDGTVCAKYTYGKAVRGLLALKLCFGSLYHYSWRYRAHEKSSRRPCAVHLADIDGCYSFSINSTELGLRSSRYGRWGQLIINATVEEQATGVVLEKQSHGPGMTFDPIRIIMKDDDNSYFKPGIPYAGRVIATKPDGTPAAGELIEVTGQNWAYDYHVQKNLTTDENGIASFYVTDIPTNVTSINFNAKAVMYGSRQSYSPYYGGRHYYGDSYLQVYTPTTYHNIKKWYSLSNSYIQIEPVEEPVRCGTNLSLTIHYTTPPNTNYKFHYIVMSNNRIIHSGHKHHQFEIQNTIDINIDTDSVLEEFVPEPIEMPWWRRPDPPIVEPPMPPTPNTSVSINSTSTTDSPVRDPVPDPIPVNEEIIVPEIVNPLGNEGAESQKEEEGEKRVPVVEDEIIPEMASILGRERRAAEDDDTADVVLSDHLSRLSITIPVSAMMSPSAQVMIYYVREDGETVSSSREFSVEKCFNNNVTMDFVEKTVHPGNEVEIRLKADPGSLCSVGVVDKSINLLGGDHQITPEKIFNMFKRFSYLYRYSYWREDREYCRQKLNRTDGYSFDIQDVDAMQAFRDMNLLVLSDLKIMTRPCQVYTMEPRVYYSMPDMQETPMQLGESGPDPRARQQPIANRGGSAQRKQETRSFFPETWLWDLELIGETGELTKRAEIPHTITKWVGNSICTNLETGMGVSSMTGITAFQPFFLSFTLPYSAIRGEEIPVLVTIFNYMSDSLVMSVSLIPSSGYMLRNDEERSRIECVHGGESSTIKYYITPVELGKIQLTASAESIFDNGTCNNRAVSLDGANAYDTVRREILIEPEGVEQEYTLTSYVCALGEEEETQMNLVLSKDLVLDSERAYINVIGDIMGPALSNLKDLLRMPYGCGEQNMASMSPNIYVLQYLTNTNQLTDKTERQAKEYMRIGYQRQLNYRHADGSYSAFGGSGSGSMWLTAFVVKCLGQSSPYIDIDVDDLDKSTTWFRRKQLENGCFPNVGYTHSIYLKGGINSSNDLSMTAFVLISMLESGVNKSDSAVLNALRCLDIHNATDTYTLSLVAYAYTLFDVNYPRRSEVMSQLLSRAKRPTGDMMYWSRNTEVTDEIPYSYYRRASSAEVEITSYALLAFITGAQVDAVSNARPIVLWLSKQRNGYGGFSSTQDTVIGLQALSRYATLVYSSDELDVTVQISGEQFDQTYSITHDNSLVLQSTPLDTLPNQLTATVSGIGCALIQANVRYNIDKVPKGPAFDLKVGVHRSKTDRNNCAKRTMQICTSYKGPGDHSHMAIVEVKMVTGWIPVKDTVRKLVKKNISRQSMEYLGIEKVEIDQNYVNFYFNELDAGKRCFYFDVEQNIEVSQPKPAFIKVYDYYETELNLVREYSIKTLCGTKEELPFLTPDEYLMGLQDEGPIMQVRVPVEIIRERVPVPNPNNEGGIDPNVFLQTCPICSGSDDFDSESKLYKKLVCDSPKIYKALSGRSGMYKMKIYADIRTKPKITVDSFSNYNMADGCLCEILKQKDQKLLIFTTENTFVKENKIIALDERSTVVAWNKILEKKINKLVRRRRGGCS